MRPDVAGQQVRFPFAVEIEASLSRAAGSTPSADRISRTELIVRLVGRERVVQKLLPFGDRDVLFRPALRSRSRRRRSPCAGRTRDWPRGDRRARPACRARRQRRRRALRRRTECVPRDPRSPAAGIRHHWPAGPAARFGQLRSDDRSVSCNGSSALEGTAKAPVQASAVSIAAARAARRLRTL